MLEPKVIEYREKAANPDKNVGLQQLEKELKDDQAKLTKLEEELRPKLKEKLVQLAKQLQASELEGHKQNLAANVLMQTVVKEQLEGKISAQKVFREKSFDEEVLRTEYESALELFDAIKAKIDAMRMNQAYPDPIEIFKEAAVPLRPDEALPFKKMGMASLAAFLLPFALAVGIEFLYRRVSSRDQLEQGGKIMVVGEVTTLPRRARRAASAGDAPSRELQLFEESIDGLRTYLSLVQSLQGMRVLAVASSISREGKTSLASQLAVSIASSTGEPTLLIDGDLRSPDIHRIFDVDRGPGVVEVLQGKTTLDEAIETGFSRKLHLLTAGQLDVSPHRILGSGEFTALIENLKGTYRHIVIDTPPILAASEALVMARTADATILCVRRDFSRLDQVQEAYARLQGASVKTAGAVLNGIPSRAYAYRYGSYYYDRARHDRVSVDSGAAEDVAASA
jgi:capsular exopolysaccharide synthesis family protein